MIQKKYVQQIHIRCTDEEKKKLQEETIKSGYKDMSSYLRFIILQKPSLDPEMKKLLHDMIYEINRIGNNINQITKDYNAFLISENDIKELKEKMKNLIEVVEAVRSDIQKK